MRGNLCGAVVMVWWGLQKVENGSGGCGLEKGGREKGSILDNYQVCDLHPMCVAVALEILPYSWFH